MNKLILLGLVLLMGVLFTAMPVTDGRVGFVFVDGSIRVVDYVYFLMEHVIKIILCYTIYSQAQRHRFPLLVFLVIQVADLIDFTLTFNNPWYSVGPIPVGINTLGIAIFTISVFHDERGSG